MSKYIDADNAIERLGAYLMTDAQIEYGGLASEDIDDWKPIAIDILKGAPSIDIVSCKECKHKQQCRKAVEHITHEPASVTIGYKSVEWCSYGERKDQ